MKLRDLITNTTPDDKVWALLVQHGTELDRFAVLLLDGMAPVGPLAWGHWHYPSEEQPFNLQDEARKSLARRLVNGMPTDLLEGEVVTVVQYAHPDAVEVHAGEGGR